MARLLAAAALGGLAGCDRVAETPSPPPAAVGLPPDALIVAIRPGPATYYETPAGDPAGFEADLLRVYAQRKHLTVRFVPMTSAAEVTATVARGAAHVGAGGLYRPTVRRLTALTERLLPHHHDAEPVVLWSAGYHTVEPVLIYNNEGFRPASWRDLAGERIDFIPNTGLDEQVARLASQHKDIDWHATDAPSGEALINDISDGRLDYAIVPSHIAALTRNVYLHFDVAFPVDGARELAWIVPPGQEQLRADIDRWLAGIRRDGTLARLVERNFGHANEVPRPDAGVLQERIQTVLPRYRPMFELAQAASGIEWRLLAAMAYQESQWDPQATSDTGVRGFMQITEETARHLGVVDRLDPKVSIHAAARYLRTLKDKLPARIQEPDRTWLALAAFNIGIGHLEDARILAQKQKLNPDLWSDVKKTLPLLAQPEFYADAKLGYARGGMPVAFVDRVRGYYDVLLAQQPVYRPRLRVLVRAEPESEPAAVVLP